jgi:autotransporter translocation and assembly factor TamB
LKYQRKIFTIEKGVIDFINPYRIEPELDIVGQSQVRDWQIFLTLSGTPEALDFKLRSEPEESDEDILSLLLFGKTSHELIRGEGGAGRSAEQMLASFIAETYGEDIKRSMGIDIFEVDAGGNDSDAAEDAIQVTLGKELTRRMTVKYAVESTRSEMIQRAIAEYKLWEHFMLRSAQDTRGTFDASLVYRLEFR